MKEGQYEYLDGGSSCIIWSVDGVVVMVEMCVVCCVGVVVDGGDWQCGLQLLQIVVGSGLVVFVLIVFGVVVLIVFVQLIGGML